MYHVSAQGVDERMINVHYYYYYYYYYYSVLFPLGFGWWMLFALSCTVCRLCRILSHIKILAHVLHVYFWDLVKTPGSSMQVQWIFLAHSVSCTFHRLFTVCVFAVDSWRVVRYFICLNVSFLDFLRPVVASIVSQTFQWFRFFVPTGGPSWCPASFSASQFSWCPASFSASQFFLVSSQF